MKYKYSYLLFALILVACKTLPEATSIPVTTSTLTPTFTNRIETESPNPSPINIQTKMLNIGDGGLLSGQPCESPCFFGIRIGETGLDQVISILKNNGISPCYEITSGTGDVDNVSFIGCGVDGWDVTVIPNSQTSLVDEISYGLSVQISVGDVIEKYREPDFIQVMRGYNNKNEKIVIASLFWDIISMEIALPTIIEPEEQIYKIEKNTIVQGIDFMSEEIYLRYSREFSIPWHGYGVYKP